MAGLPTIVCPIDFSEHSKRALQYAVFIAEHFGANLTIFNAVDPMLAGAASVHQTDLIADTEADLREIVEKPIAPLKARRGAVKLVVRQGHAAAEILRTVHKDRADLIVMGSHGLSGYRKMVFGSTTERVLRQSHVPVLCVPLGDQDLSLADDGRRLALDPILAPVDFSEPSTLAARVAAGIAGATGARFVLVHAVAPVHAIARWHETARAQERATADAAGAQLAELAQSLSAAAPPETEVRVGAPADVIAAVAAERKARLIVMGLRGAGGLLGHAPGTVAYRVLCAVPVAVLALPARAPASNGFARATAAASSEPVAG